MASSIRSPGELGARIAEAREEAGMTQAELAALLELDRTSVVRLEAGNRKVSASELASIAQALGRSIDWFVLVSPPAVLSRRRDSATTHSTSLAMDVAIDRAARDAQFLLDRGILAWSQTQPEAVPGSHEEAEALASRVRKHLGLSDDPLCDLGEKAEQLGVMAFAMDLGGTTDGACVELVGPDDQRLGVAVIDGTQDPGRRRWTLAHELGHFIVGDAYAADHPGGEIEKYLNSFVAHLLMPSSGVERVWREMSQLGERVAALAISARYRTSWTATCSHLFTLKLLGRDRFEQLRSDHPTSGDYLVSGESWEEELRAPFVPPTYTQRVLAAYADGQLTAARTVELLHSTLTVDDLPAREPVSLDSLRSAFDPLL